MKLIKLFFFCILLTICVQYFGQSNFHLFDQNKKYTSISAKGGWNSSRASGTVNLRGSYFILGKLSLGLEIGYGKNGSFYRHFQSVIPLRYNIINRKLSPFAELTFHHFNYKYSGPPEYTGVWNELRAGVGLS